MLSTISFRFATLRSVGEGTGLGLSLALGIAEAHSGSLRLIPVPSGACFRLTIPSTAMPVMAPPPPAAPPALNLPSEMMAAPTVNGRRALVVDDEPALRLMLQRLLTRRGFTVDVAEDGRPACALLEQQHYDVIFCDWQMPNMGGPPLLEWIRGRRPGLLSGVVFVTGGTLNPELQSMLESRHIPVLLKPYNTAALDALLERVLSDRLRDERALA